MAKRTRVSKKAKKTTKSDALFDIALMIRSTSESNDASTEFPMSMSFMDEDECIIFWSAMNDFGGSLLQLSKEEGFALDREETAELYGVEISATITKGDDMVMAIGPIKFPNLDRKEVGMFWITAKAFVDHLIKLAKENGFALDRETIPLD